MTGSSLRSAVPFDGIAGLPGWLLAGLGLGGVWALLLTAVFLVGERWFPSGAPIGGGRVYGEDKRRAEVRGYLSAIDEAFVEDRRVAGHPVAFFLPDRGVAITFDPRAYFGLQDAGVYPILIEQEMPGAHLAGRLPFETPSIGHPAPTVDSVREAFGVLGVAPTAPAEEVRAAYRTRVKEAHPDHGGDPDAFKRVCEAYATIRERAG